MGSTGWGRGPGARGRLAGVGAPLPEGTQVYENGVWKTTDTASTSQGDYTGPTVRLPARGAMMRVKLMKY